MNLEEATATIDRLTQQRDIAQTDRSTAMGSIRQLRRSLDDAIDILMLVRPCVGQSVPENALANAVDFANYLVGRINQVVEEPQIAEAAAASGVPVRRSPRLPGPMMTVYAGFAGGRISLADLPQALEEAARFIREA